MNNPPQAAAPPPRSGTPVSLDEALATRRTRVYAYLAEQGRLRRFEPQHLREAAFAYLDHPGKALRGAIVLLGCSALGGDEDQALPAAAALELYHTWTLVHDDIIDRDPLRRGQPSVHAAFAARARDESGHAEAEAAHYGTCVAILAGDVQHAWSIQLLTQLAERGVPPAVVTALVAELAGHVTPRLLEGELLDVQLSTAPVASLDEARVLHMIGLKTGALLEFAGRAGTAIACRDASLRAPAVEELAAFCRLAGIAFQLQDDVLGITGNEDQLGKPVGSDLREGKRTPILLHAYAHASASERETLARVVGNPAASPAQSAEATAILERRGGVDHARRLATDHLAQAMTHLDALPPSPSRELLRAIGARMIDRQR